jgi:glycosyltransferase involved in cell wall biosynthesis
MLLEARHAALCGDAYSSAAGGCGGAMVELSVIIPTYNRAAPLRACLEALARQTQPASDFEVIVVVDGSTDGTADMLARYGSSLPLRVHVQENRGQAAARNRGLELAIGQYCLFIDDDIIAEPGLIAEHLCVQREHQGVVGLGHLTCRLPRNADGFAHSVAAWWDDHYADFRKGSRAPSFIDCFSGNLSAPRSALLQIGGFAIDLPHSEDLEVGYRLAQHGLAIVYIPDAVGDQKYTKNFREIVADARAEGLANLELYRRHPPMLPTLLLGRFTDARPRVVLLRRLLLALSVPMGLLQLMSPMVGRRRRARTWYSFVYDYAYWRAVRRGVPDRDTWRRLTRGPIILMYHAFGGPGEPPSRYVVPGRRFARQLRWLKRCGYRVIRLEELVRLRREFRLAPADSVVITIDDGYADNHGVAYPILQHHDFPATIFLVSGAIGDRNHWDRGEVLAGRSLLDWPAIHEMRRGSIDYGAHTRTHRALSDLPADELDQEVAGSRADLERALGQSIVAFAYPYGTLDATSYASVERAGFLGACGVRDGVNSAATPSHALHRTEVFGTDSLVTFALAVWLGDPLRQFCRWGRR